MSALLSDERNPQSQYLPQRIGVRFARLTLCPLVKSTRYSDGVGTDQRA